MSLGADIGLFWDLVSGQADVSISANDLDTDAGLETAVSLSLFTDARADDDDVLPDTSGDRRGWWGDAFPTADGDVWGSKLWLLARAKDTPDVPKRAADYAKAALQWLVDDLVASAVSVTATRSVLDGRDSELLLVVSVQRPNGNAAAFRYNYNWSSQEAKRV